MHRGTSDPEQIDIDDDEELLIHTHAYTHTNGVWVHFSFPSPNLVTYHSS